MNEFILIIKLIQYLCSGYTFVMDKHYCTVTVQDNGTVLIKDNVTGEELLLDNSYHGIMVDTDTIKFRYNHYNREISMFKDIKVNWTETFTDNAVVGGFIVFVMFLIYVMSFICLVEE